eukprot:348561-Pelagomonas_calceolata.AAC.3
MDNCGLVLKIQKPCCPIKNTAAGTNQEFQVAWLCAREAPKDRGKGRYSDVTLSYPEVPKDEEKSLRKNELRMNRPKTNEVL